MSQENVEIIRSIYDGWLRGELGTEKFDPEIAMIESTAVPGAPAAYGIDAVRRYIESFSKYWKEIRFEPREYIDAGDQVIVVARLVGRGKSSGVEVQREWSYVWTVRGNRALRMTAYSDRSEAFTAAGFEG